MRKIMKINKKIVLIKSRRFRKIRAAASRIIIVKPTALFVRYVVGRSYPG